jgi:SAM-dependent methyltransferase
MDAAASFASIVAVDTPEPERPLSPDLLEAPCVAYVQAQGPPLPFRTGCFDTVCASHVLHHLPPHAREPALGGLKRVLRPGGRFLLVAGYRDLQSGARKTQIMCHALRAAIDRAEGMQHYPTLLRAEIVELVASMGFERCETCDVAPWRDDYRDPANLANIARFIDREIEKRSHLPGYEAYRQAGERLKKRMSRTGYLGSKALVAICR